MKPIDKTFIGQSQIAMNTILCINGSDSMGHSGIQADIRTIKDLGGYAVTAVTSVTVQNHTGIRAVHELPSELVSGQIRAIYEEVHPNAVKVGMICDPDTIRIVRDEIVGCPHIVCSPVILAANGGCLMGNDAIHAFCHDLLPICSLLMLKCVDAEIILGRRITTDEDMLQAAQELQERGAQWVLLRGGTYLEGHINALLTNLGEDAMQPHVANIPGMTDCLAQLQNAQTAFEAKRAEYQTRRGAMRSSDSATALKGQILVKLNSELIPYFRVMDTAKGGSYSEFYAMMREVAESANVTASLHRGRKKAAAKDETVSEPLQPIEEGGLSA